MADHGPIPKRSEERRRRNKPETPQDKVEVTGKVPIPRADSKWHPIAKRLYRSLQDSGQAKFYEPSDWAAAQLICESLSRDLSEQFVGIAEKTGEAMYATIPLKGASLAAYLKAFAALGVSEGDRRRIGIEVTRKPGKPALAKVSVMDEYRDALGG
jgi:hypothetical protein